MMYADEDNSGVTITGTWLEKKWNSIVRMCIFNATQKVIAEGLVPNVAVFRSGAVGR